MEGIVRLVWAAEGWNEAACTGACSFHIQKIITAQSPITADRKINLAFALISHFQKECMPLLLVTLFYKIS